MCIFWKHCFPILKFTGSGSSEPGWATTIFNTITRTLATSEKANLRRCFRRWPLLHLHRGIPEVHGEVLHYKSTVRFLYGRLQVVWIVPFQTRPCLPFGIALCQRWLSDLAKFRCPWLSYQVSDQCQVVDKFFFSISWQCTHITFCFMWTSL